MTAPASLYRRIRATAKLSLDDRTVTIEDWRQAFEAGFRDDELAATHVRLLIVEGREEEALAFLDKDVFVTEVVRAGLSGVVRAHMNEEDLAGRALAAMEAALFDEALLNLKRAVEMFAKDSPDEQAL